MVVFQNILQQMALKEVSMGELSELSIDGVLCEKCGYKYSKKEDTFYKDNFWAEVNPVEVNRLCGRYSKI